jgi:hypothetical protein
MEHGGDGRAVSQEFSPTTDAARQRHKTRGQLACHEPLHQTFGVGEILLAPLRPAVRRRLRQMQFPDIRPAPSRF